jgi:phosphoheptose isomerase
MEGRWGEHFAQHLEAAAGLQVQVAARCARSVDAAVAAIVTSLRGGGKLMLCGNGGSAADCQHMAAALTCRLTKDFERPAIQRSR